MKKKIFLIVYYLNPILTPFILGFMQGTWFDAENLLKKDDVEIYTIPQWQYSIYYGVLCFLLLWSVFFMIKYFISTTSYIRYIHLVFLCILNSLLFIVFYFL